MDIGDTVSLSEIKLPDGVEITILQQDEDRDQAVVSVTETREMIIEEEEELELVEGEEGEEGEEATEGSEEDSETPTEDKESDSSEEEQKE